MYVGFAILRPLPELKITITPPVIPAMVRVNIPWPATGQAAFGADGYGLLDQSNADITTIKPTPMASVTKVITALAILEKKPLKLGEQGPAVPFTQADVDLYNQYVAKDGSVVPVSPGQSMTEYQALQAIMLASANNIADTMAIATFGSLSAYTEYANAYVKKLGMTQTTIADASGFSPSTASTATDLIRLGDVAIDHPVLSEIMNQKTAIFPGVGTITNVNALLGQSGIRGIKTGNTEEAGGCYLAVADVMIGDKKISVITAVMSAPNRTLAMSSSLPLIQSAPAQFQNVRVVRNGQVVGKATTAWGSTSDITADKEIDVTAWAGTSISPEAAASSIDSTATAGQKVGSLKLNFNGSTQSSDLKLSGSLSSPSLWWRLTHPY